MIAFGLSFLLASNRNILYSSIKDYFSHDEKWGEVIFFSLQNIYVQLIC